jgi:hypothetical protein
VNANSDATGAVELVRKELLTLKGQICLLPVDMPNPVLGSTEPYSGGALDAR